MSASFGRVAASLFVAPFALAVAAALATTDAKADDAGAGFVTDANNPCGTFDFSNGINCKIEVSGGCTAKCTPLKFVAACSGHCTATATQDCTNTCGEACIKQCNPQLLDCFKGCHDECDQPTVTQCQKDHPNDDCVTKAKAQCDMHCKDQCKVPGNSCQEHCDKCCTGACTTQVNFDCDFKCMVDVQGGCTAKCTKPEGGLFCNDQYVHASDVAACIKYLATKGLKVDVSARGQAACDLNGCTGSGSGTGCAASPGTNVGFGGALAIGAFAVVAGIARARRRKDGAQKG